MQCRYVSSGSQLKISFNTVLPAVAKLILTGREKIKLRGIASVGLKSVYLIKYNELTFYNILLLLMTKKTNKTLNSIIIYINTMVSTSNV